MRLLKGILRGLAACLAGTAAAQDADQPSAPLDYVRVCNTSGAAFFVVPGAESCRPPGRPGLGEEHRFGPRTIASGASICGGGIAREARGFVTGPSQATSRTDRDGIGTEASRQRELTAPLALSYDVTHSFLKADPIWVSAGTRPAGGDGSRALSASREAYGTTFVDKAFIRFAGLTAGQALSFQAEAHDCVNRAGFDATIGSLAYAATFGDGFSTWIAFEDQASRRPAGLGTIASWPEADPISINGISAPSFRAGSGGREIPEIVGDPRRDQSWGAVQVDAAALQVHAGLFTNQALTAPSPAYPIPPLPSNSYGLASQGGARPNMDYLSPGDRLWLQAAYENGVYGTVAGTNRGSTPDAADVSRVGRAVVAPLDNVYGWRPQPSADCVWTGNFTCEPRRDRENGADASKRFWPPTFSSAVYGPSQDVRYAPAAIAGFGGAMAVSNIPETRNGPSFIGMPISGFDIGAEFMYIDVKQARRGGAPARVEPGGTPAAVAPTANGNQTEYQGRLRVQRAF